MQNMISVLQEAGELLRIGEYARAASVLSQIDTCSLSRDALGEFYLVRAEARLFISDLEHRDAVEAIEIFRATAENAKYAQAKYLHGWQLQSLGRSSDARETLSEAYAAFLRANDKQGAARTLNRLSAVAFQSGDLSYAFRILCKTSSLCREIDRLDQAVTVEGNEALMRWRCGEIRRSIALYDRIGTDIECVSARNRVVIMLGHAMAIALAGDTKSALKKLKSLESQTESHPREHAICYEYLGWSHLLASDHAKAENALSMSLNLALDISSVNDHVSQTKRLLADLCVATRRYDQAWEYAQQALDVATRITERLEIAACHRVFAQVEQRRGHADDARRWYRESIDLFSRIGARYEVAVTRMLAAASNLHANGERMALLYLAREYFESEDLAHLVAEVDRHLAAAPAVKTAKRIGGGSTSKTPIIIAASSGMRKLVDFADHIARCDMTVLLTGETGTGKDLLARYIHHASGRTGEFVTVNAAAIPSSMIEAELFGHRKGSFTGATADRPGLFEQASGGTFYLNEIGDASAEFQAKLLEVLDTRTIRRLGENNQQTVDFRLIAATNHDLQRRIKDNLFRLDLYHRLKEISICLPPLADRIEDMPGLVTYFLAEQNGRSYEPSDVTRLAVALAARPWPGNIRELRAVVTEMQVSCAGEIDRMIDHSLQMAGESETDRLLNVLDATGWNRTRAAEVLGLSEGAIRHRIRKLGLDDSPDDDHNVDGDYDPFEDDHRPYN